MTVTPQFPLKDTKLFQPIKVGNNELSNRIAFVPTTRFRALEDHSPSDLQVEYYKARSQYPGTLIETEATFVSESAGLYPHVPGIYQKSHVQGWKKVNDAIHANKSFSVIQLWNLGRVADPKSLKQAGLTLRGPSAIYPDEAQEKNAIEAGNPIKELTEDEIQDMIYNQYPQAARNALEAGFDYMELHAAHGYLFDQFLQPASNKRTDKYGGSIENRARFLLEVIDNLIPIVGADKLAIRISPWATFQGMEAENDEVHPVTTFSYLLHELQKRANKGNKLAFISVVEPRANGNIDVDVSKYSLQSNSFVGLIWKGIILKAGNYTYDAPEFKTIQQDIQDDRTLIGFSRYFTSNPDLVHRLAEGLELTPYNRDTFYTPANWGYNTWSNYNSADKFDEEVESKRLPKPVESTKAVSQ